MDARRLLYNRRDLEAFDDYDRMLIVHNRASEGTLAALPMAGFGDYEEGPGPG